MRTTFTILTLLLASSLFAQEEKPISMRLEARGDYKREYVDGQYQKDPSGFKGEMLDVYLQGSIGQKFSYKYRQRLNGINRDYNFFDATDWLYMAYSPSERLTLMAGKWVVLTGCWEFDPAPIDVYQLGEFCYHFPCYNWGVNAIVSTKKGNDKFIAQICESPFRRQYKQKHGEAGEMYAFNLVWYGNHGFYHSSSSLNLMAYAPGRYISYLCLGNRFNIGRHIEWDIDFMNRAASGQPLFFRDCSIMSRFAYRFSPMVSAFAKASYDVNRTHTDKDLGLNQGTEITRVGAGVEFFPLKDDRVRLHANYSYAFGHNTTPHAVVRPKQSYFDIGLTWRMKIL